MYGFNALIETKIEIEERDRDRDRDRDWEKINIEIEVLEIVLVDIENHEILYSFYPYDTTSTKYVSWLVVLSTGW